MWTLKKMQGVTMGTQSEARKGKGKGKYGLRKGKSREQGKSRHLETLAKAKKKVISK